MMRSPIRETIVLSILIFLTCCIADRVHIEDLVPGKASGHKINLEDNRKIPLNTHDPKQIADVNSIQVAEDHFLILDTFYAQQAYVVEFDGSLIKTIGNTGSGPGEYRLPGGFCFSGDRFFVISSGEGKLNIYDANGSFLKWAPQVSSGIGSHLYPGPDGTVFATTFSRYAKNASIYKLNSDGELITGFSPLDEQYWKVFDTFHPPGGLVVTNNEIIQFFNHRYEVIFWTLTGEEIKRQSLHSSIYIEPEYEKTEGIRGHKNERKFMRSFTHFSGFHKTENGYVSVLKQFVSKSTTKETLEFWDNEFKGIGRHVVPEGEKFLGVSGDSLIFFGEVSDASMLILRVIEGSN